MKKTILGFSALTSLLITSCSKTDQIGGTLTVAPTVSILNLSGDTNVAQEDTIYLKAQVSTGSDFSWLVDGKPIEGVDSVLKFVSTDLGEHTVSLVANNKDQKASVQQKISVYGKYKHGTFILNEGNMTAETGSLVFISPKGVITDSAYFKANGSFLGNVTQDLYIFNGKMYIISQNGTTSATGTSFASDGRLVVANAETLKKEASYNDELSTLSWPTHVAVLNEQNIIIRDNKGLNRFNSDTKTLTFIEGSKSAAKNTMAISNNKVFAGAGSKIYVVEPDKDAVSFVIDMKATISGVVKADDGNIWVSTTNPARITKLNYRDHSIIKTNELTTGLVGAGVAATPGITAKGDTLYFSNTSTKIYRHVFSTNATEFMIDAKTVVADAGIVYNNIAVNPITGEVVLNTIKGFGMNFLINNISVFNFNISRKLSANYQNHTRFPAGTFFTYNF